jgi:16S rRNA (adenine1518-N6/adenine1519-N6)-dimethyltransferase
LAPTPDIPALLRRYGLHPDKRLGQNFLLDETALGRVAGVAEIAPSHTVLEIGPGLGSLTLYLAARACQVVAVELDPDLIPPLQEVLSDCTNVRLVQGDILVLDPANLVSEPGYLVVANIPYYITSALIRHLLEANRRPARLVLTVQQEVAERVCAKAGEMSLLALSVQVYGQPRIMGHIPAGAFYPSPKVDSAILRVDLYPEPRIPLDLLAHFFHLVKAGFSQKRKTLRNALAGGLGWKPAQAEILLSQARIDAMRRAETLDFPEWERLVEIYRLIVEG